MLVKRSNKRLFKYHTTNQPLDTIQQFFSHADYQEVILHGPDFFKLIQDSPKGVHYYSSGGIELLQLQTLPYSEASLQQVTFDPHRGPGQVNYWFGGANVIAHTHYDTSHNLHAVIHGRKTFLIFPPSTYQDLLLYPCLHQLYRQVQVMMSTESHVRQHYSTCIYRIALIFCGSKFLRLS